MLNGVKENLLSKNGSLVNINYFSGAKINDIYKHLDKLLERRPDIVMLHIGTNNCTQMSSNGIVDELLILKHHIEKILPDCQVILSSLTPRIDDGKATLTVKRFNQKLKQLKLEVMDNSNITVKDLGKKGLLLSKIEKCKLARNILKKIDELNER
jgi:hypothetical protein